MMVLVPLLATLVLSACGSAQEGTVSATRPAAALESTALFGAFTFGGVWRGMDPIYELELDLGRRLDVVHWFTNWDNPYFPELVAMASQGGRRPMISWQSYDRSVEDIAAGKYDAYITEWARGAATAPGLLYVRPFPEMNGDWTQWSGDPEGLKRAWRRIVGIFDSVGATNVRWVFSPNVTDSPRVPENAMELYYPGDDYVDVLALDGYNWGDVLPSVGWRSFEAIFRAGYDRVTSLGAQPVWIAELASSNVGGDKSDWVREMFATTGFERIEALVWFNENKEADWRIDSDVATLHAFRQMLSAGTAVAAVR
ncbi:MAG: hypothetical protein KF875_08805 [Trueperaceae bacterium]|nr:hypothetical protein [Trueperaceae bacterium]MCC6311538.1 hypothetical protein [Trueperaceae bacterium]MCO5175066.1 hypothetical protein [Trueperaceae bacterium]MCW5819320.1 hypothetical protein [Trueperaceae bacterium]